MLVKLLAIVLIIAAVQLNEVKALKCYECGSTKDWSSCEDVKKEVTCPSSMNNCGKGEVSYKANGIDFHVFAKGCTNICKTENWQPCKNAEGIDVKCQINCCDSDLCNAGSVPLVSGFIMMACALLSALTYVF